MSKVRKISLILIFICIIVFVSGCGEEEKNNVNNNENINLGFQLKESQTTISRNETYQIELDVTKTFMNFDSNKLEWSSSNNEVASVDDKGLVTSYNYGFSLIIVKYLDNGKVVTEQSFELIVADGNSEIKATGVEFPEGVVVLNVGDEFQLTYDAVPQNAYVSSASFFSSDDTLVSVDKNGKILANAIGEAEITIKLGSGNLEYSDTILVKVISEDFEPKIIIPIEKIVFDKESMDLEVGDSEYIKYTVTPKNASTELLTWGSSDKSVVSVDDKGQVKGLKIDHGKIITAKYLFNEKIKDEITINVLRKFIKIENVSVNNLIELEVGKTHRIKFNVTPLNATIDNIKYDVVDEKIAIVDDNGLITAKAPGTTEVKIIFESYSSDNNIYKKEVPITIKVGSISDNNNGPTPDWAKELPSSVTIRLWENNNYSFNVNTSISHCSSNNTNVLGVNQALTSGKTNVTINGKKAGVTSINLTDTNGYKATVQVYVYSCSEYGPGELLSTEEVEAKKDDASDYIKYNPISRYKYTLIKIYTNDNKETVEKEIYSTFPYSTETKMNDDCKSSVVPNETIQEGKYEYRLYNMRCENIEKITIYERKEYKKVCKIYTDGKNTFENDK